MSYHIDPILLIGCGSMGIEYAKVLNGMKQPFYAFTRSEKTAARFKVKTGHEACWGDFEKFLLERPYHKAIVAVPVHHLKDTALILMQRGVKEILLEKPGATSLSELLEIESASSKYDAKVFIGYNRRFYESVQKLQTFVTKANPIHSIHFDFTELTKRIEHSEISEEVKTIWLLANSSHVIDLAFFLAGKPKTIKGFVSNQVDWHPKGAIFTGSGETVYDVLFSYHANWRAPGRWGIEVRTDEYTFRLQPLEKLYMSRHGSFDIEEVPLASYYDLKFKPGFYKQVEAFLTDKAHLVNLEEQRRNMREIYSFILTGD
jgi:predicted dehydrogenase